MKEKIIVVCRYENWCINWFNILLRFLAYNVYSQNKEVIKVNKRRRCICLPEKEIWFISDAKMNHARGGLPDKIISWSGNDVNELWNKI